MSTVQPCQSNSCVPNDDDTGLENCGDDARFIISHPAEDGTTIAVCPDALAVEVEVRQELWDADWVKVSTILEDEEDDEVEG